MKYTLKNPIEFDGEQVTEINLTLDALNGQDIINVDRQFFLSSQANQAVQLKENTKEYQMLIAATAASKPIEFFTMLKIKDFNEICFKVQRFLLYGDLEVDQ